jgi:acyl carrier protein
MIRLTKIGSERSVLRVPGNNFFSRALNMTGSDVKQSMRRGLSMIMPASFRSDAIANLTQPTVSAEFANDKIYLAVVQIVADQLKLSEEKIATITENSRLKKDLGTDSLDAVEQVMALEEEFDVDIPDEDIKEFITIGDYVRYLKTKLNLHGAPKEEVIISPPYAVMVGPAIQPASAAPMGEKEVEERIIRIVANILSVPVERVKRGSKIISDFDLDILTIGAFRSELSRAIKAEFKIDEKEVDFEARVETVDDIIYYVTQILKASFIRMTEEEILNRVIKVTARRFPGTGETSKDTELTNLYEGLLEEEVEISKGITWEVLDEFGAFDANYFASRFQLACGIITVGDIADVIIDYQKWLKDKQSKA